MNAYMDEVEKKKLSHFLLMFHLSISDFQLLLNENMCGNLMPCTSTQISSDDEKKNIYLKTKTICEPKHRALGTASGSNSNSERGKKNKTDSTHLELVKMVCECHVEGNNGKKIFRTKKKKT